jgi:hypothetical protein
MPIGRMAVKYTRGFISTFRLSTSLVVRANTCVAMVAKNMCHVVSVMENGNLSRIHLLNTITIELNPIHALHRGQQCFTPNHQGVYYSHDVQQTFYFASDRLQRCHVRNVGLKRVANRGLVVVIPTCDSGSLVQISGVLTALKAESTSLIVVCTTPQSVP